MDREYTRDPAWAPEVVVVGAASRDVAADDPRGWRLGGGVTYSALTTARLGLRTAALVGVDGAADGVATGSSAWNRWTPEPKNSAGPETVAHTRSSSPTTTAADSRTSRPVLPVTRRSLLNDAVAQDLQRFSGRLPVR